MQKEKIIGRQLWEDAFFKCIWPFIQEYQLTPNEEKLLKSNIKAATKEAIRKLSDGLPEYASEAAIDACNEIGCDIFSLSWPQRNILDRDEKNRSRLMYEHPIPISQFFDSLVQCNNIEDAKKVISEYPRVCWILREEDDHLKKSGYNSCRPNGWQAAYQECGIKVVKSPYYKK